MTEIHPFLKELISAPGLSGHEEPVRKIIEKTWSPLADELSLSRLGSLHALRRADPATGTSPSSILYTAHMDAIGLMVRRIVAGFLGVIQVGGVDARVLPGQIVTVHGRKDLLGIVVQPAAHLLPSEYREKPVPLEYLWVDIGYSPEEVSNLVRVGDLVSFAQPPLEMSDETLAGHSLDNRASVAALTVCLQELQGRKLNWDVWLAATTQEEVTLGGALTSAFGLRPTLAVAIDVTFAASPGSPAHNTYPMGKGITLGWGPNIHPALFEAFKELADRLEIPWKIDVMPRMSGTDAAALQIAGEGIPTMVISIPLRYMHTPVEMISMRDIQRTGRLLAEFAVQLDSTFMNKIVWDEIV